MSLSNPLNVFRLDYMTQIMLRSTLIISEVSGQSTMIDGFYGPKDGMLKVLNNATSQNEMWQK